MGGGKRRSFETTRVEKTEIYRKELETCSSKTEMDERSNSITRLQKETSQGYKSVVQFAATGKIAKMGPSL